MEDPSGALLTGFKLVAVLVLALANGFFVAAEFALVSVRRSRVAQLVEDGVPMSGAVERGTRNLDAYLAACQLGITMASLALGWIGEPALAHLIEPLFAALPTPWANVGAHGLAIAVAFSIITTLHIVLGELAPKSLAIQLSERTALWTARPLEIYLKIFRPAIMGLNGLGNLLLRGFGLRPASEHSLVHSIDELKTLMDSSRDAGVLAEREEAMVDSVLRLREQRVGALMTPRTEIVWLDLEHSLDDNLDRIQETGFSRFPVARESLDGIQGIVKAKELLDRNLAGQRLDLERALRQPLFVPETMSALKVLDRFKHARTHLALVVDEHGGIEGLVTLNDLMEAIVGELPMAESPAEPRATRRDDGSWLLDGMLPIEELKDLLGLPDVPEEERHNYETLAGFVVLRLEDIPQEGQVFDWGQWHFEVMDMDGHRVDKVLATPEPPTLEEQLEEEFEE